MAKCQIRGFYTALFVLQFGRGDKKACYLQVRKFRKTGISRIIVYGDNDSDFLLSLWRNSAEKKEYIVSYRTDENKGGFVYLFVKICIKKASKKD